jgi:hypothetical protein
MVSEVSMQVWNRISETPRFRHLAPRDFPAVYEAVEQTLRRYRPLRAGKTPSSIKAS